MNKSWWKILCVVLLLYTLIAGFNVFDLSFFTVPRLPIVQESIRNLYFHVCMWFAMMTLFTISVIQSIKYLRSLDIRKDIKAQEYATTGTVMGLLGYATGAIWASFTWADPNNPAYAS